MVALSIFILLFMITLSEAQSDSHSDDTEYDDFEDHELPTDWRSRFDDITLQGSNGSLNYDDIIHDEHVIMYDSMPYHSDPIIRREKPHRAEIRKPAALWPVSRKRPIAFEIHRFFTFQQDRFLIRKVLMDIENQTRGCISFKERTDEKNGIIFTPAANTNYSGQCKSYVGMQRGLQPIFLDQICMEFGTILHEIMHALGFFHEHCRPDRDQYIEIFPKHASQDAGPVNFQINPHINSYGVPYDLESIMHYGPYDFARNPLVPVIIPKRGANHAMGQRKGLSVGDINKLLAAYSCHNTDSEPVTDSSSEGSDTLFQLSRKPMSFEQCRPQFNTHCGRTGFTVSNCTLTITLAIICDHTVTNHIVREMAQLMAQPPLRAMQVFLLDKLVSTFTLFSVRLQILVFEIMYCAGRRTSAKLTILRLESLSMFALHHCDGLVLKKSDFIYSKGLRVMRFYLSTIQTLEYGTFMDLPYLQVLALEAGMADLPAFDEEIQSHIKRIHCHCSFSWLRSWWESNANLKKAAAEGEIYSTYFANRAYRKQDIYLPINCSAIPTGPQCVDSIQDDFSVNEPLCTGGNSTVALYYEETKFSIEPMSAEQCALQFTANCHPQRLSVQNCTLYSTLLITCDDSVTEMELRNMVFAMSKPPSRAVMILLPDGGYFRFFVFRAVRSQVIGFWITSCISNRITNKLSELAFANLLTFHLIHCKDIVLYRKDFSETPKIKEIIFVRTTIRYLENNAFDSLLQLRALSLEWMLGRLTKISRGERDFVSKLHCSCEYAWFRNWWAQNDALVFESKAGALFAIDNSRGNTEITKKDVFLPVDCAALPVPVDPSLLDFTQAKFSKNAPDCSNVTFENITVIHAEFSADPMTADQCRLQFTDNCASQFNKAENCSRIRLLDVSCNESALENEIDALIEALSAPPTRPIRLIFGDNRWSSLSDDTFKLIQPQVILVQLFDCVSNRTTATLSRFGLFFLLEFTLCNCIDTSIARSDFTPLTAIKVITFRNTTIAAMEQGSFTDLLELRLISLEYGLASRLSHDPDIVVYVLLLHCSCEFAWFRGWWNGNRDLLHRAEQAEIYVIPTVMGNDAYSKSQIYLPVDCGRISWMHDNVRFFVNFTAEQFSVNEPECE